MSTVEAARATFGMTLFFHIILASLGVVMPFMLIVSEWMWLRRKDPVYRALNRKWTQAFAATYAVGAVSGTVLTFGFGLFWPNFMNVAGPVIGYPLAIEVLFFLTEAIFLGIYVFGRDLLSPWVHWLSGLPLLIGGFFSMIVVVLANSWMNTPVGFTLNAAGRVVSVDLLQAMFSPAAFNETTHMTGAAFEAVAFGFAAVYAFGILRGRRDAYHKKALIMAMVVVTFVAPAMIVSGDLTAKYLAKEEPAKLAAMEPIFKTEKGAALSIGGYPDKKTGEVKYDIKIPKMLSILATDSPNGTVRGLDSFPKDYRPNPVAVWWAFDAMVGIGFFLVTVVGWFWFAFWRKRSLPTGDTMLSKWLLRTITLSGFLGFAAIELGWITTEEGRQPWIIKGIMRTAEGSTTAPGLVIVMFVFGLLYAVLAATLIWLLRGMATGAPDDLKDEENRNSGSPRKESEYAAS